jgi:hypothetical protein
MVMYTTILPVELKRIGLAKGGGLFLILEGYWSQHKIDIKRVNPGRWWQSGEGHLVGAAPSYPTETF